MPKITKINAYQKQRITIAILNAVESLAMQAISENYPCAKRDPVELVRYCLEYLEGQITGQGSTPSLTRRSSAKTRAGK